MQYSESPPAPPPHRDATQENQTIFTSNMICSLGQYPLLIGRLVDVTPGANNTQDEKKILNFEARGDTKEIFLKISGQLFGAF